MYLGSSWKRELLLKHSPVVGGAHAGTMDNANPSPSVRTGHINEVCGSSPQKISGMGTGPTET
jgi:hypothetical protein